MAGWRCFMVRPSAFLERSLRRYASSGRRCPGLLGYHDASVIVDAMLPAGTDPVSRSGQGDYEGDPRWPAKCDSCDYRFHPEDNFQVNVSELYEGSPDGELHPLRRLPPGAIWNAHWFEDVKGNKYCAPDGKVWCLMMPCMVEWIIYGPAEDGKKWEVTGDLPIIDVKPSINLEGAYHGHVRAGIISEDVEGRTFPNLMRTA